MDMNKPIWLPHLENRPPGIHGYRTDIYAMAMEGWKRGLSLKFIKYPGSAISPSLRYSLSDGSKEHLFSVARGDLVSKKAILICENKTLTYKYLKRRNVPIPEGKTFGGEVNADEIINYADSIGFPLVVKPADGNSGKGVITDIKTAEGVEEALKHVRDELGYKNIIVERFIVGQDYRIYVVDGKVVGAYKRVTTNIIGDGSSTIRELIKLKNILRKKNPFIVNRPIKIDDNMLEILSSKNYDLTTIPPKGERVFLRRHGTYFKERDPNDVTDELPENIKKIATDAVKAISGLTHCNVDMLINEEKNLGYVNEINSRPQISNHLFPMEGKARDIPKAIIDYYFPETKDKIVNDKFYFDLPSIYEILWSGDSKKVIVPDVPSIDDISIQLFLVGAKVSPRLNRRLRYHAVKIGLNGFVEYLNNGKISIVVSGEIDQIELFKKHMNDEIKTTFKVDNIVEGKWDKPLRIGFHFINKNFESTKTFGNSNEEIISLKNKYDVNQNEINNLSLELQNLKKSRSWKVTSIARKITSKVKKRK